MPNLFLRLCVGAVGCWWLFFLLLLLLLFFSPIPPLRPPLVRSFALEMARRCHNCGPVAISYGGSGTPLVDGGYAPSRAEGDQTKKYLRTRDPHRPRTARLWRRHAALERKTPRLRTASQLGQRARRNRRRRARPVKPARAISSNNFFSIKKDYYLTKK